MTNSFGPKAIGYLLTYPGCHPHVRGTLLSFGSEVMGSLETIPVTTHTSETLSGGAA